MALWWLKVEHVTDITGFFLSPRHFTLQSFFLKLLYRNTSLWCFLILLHFKVTVFGSEFLLLNCMASASGFVFLTYTCKLGINLLPLPAQPVQTSVTWVWWDTTSCLKVSTCWTTMGMWWDPPKSLQDMWVFFIFYFCTLSGTFHVNTFAVFRWNTTYDGWQWRKWIISYSTPVIQLPSDPITGKIKSNSLQCLKWSVCTMFSFFPPRQ